MNIGPELPLVQSRCAHCPPMNQGAKIFLALGVISLIGGVLATCYALQFLTASHWLFYTGCGVVVLSFVAFSLTAICARFFGQRAGTPRIFFEPEEIMPIQGPRTYAINNNIIHITLSQHELRSEPELHLNSLAGQIDRHVVASAVPRVHVQFNGQNGGDVGGLTAIYFNDLVSGITSKEHLFKQLEDSFYYLPNPQPNQNLLVFKQLGKMMMYCYPTFVIGDHFDHSLFVVALSFSNNELDHPFRSLSIFRKIELYRILINNLGEEVHPANRRMVNCLSCDVDRWSEEELIEAISLVDGQNQMPPHLLDDDVPNINLIKGSKENKQQIKDALFIVAAHLYDPQIRGIHAIAKGMRSVCHKGERNQDNNRVWEWLCQNTTPEVFNERLQGSIDRDFIIGKIVIEHLIQARDAQGVINQKVEWLKAWIRNEATPDSDIRAFLKYVTGSTCLPTNLPEVDPKGKITVRWQAEVENRSHHPRASTCFNILYLSPQYHVVERQRADGSQKGFIRSLKEAIAFSGGLVLRD